MMKKEYSFSYFACPACASKNNCEKCGRDVADSMMRSGLAGSVSIDMKKKIMSVETDPGAEEDLIDYLDGIGVFV